MKDIKRGVIISTVIIVLVIGVGVYLSKTSDKEVELPNLVGLTTQEAEQKALASGFKFEVDKEQHKDNLNKDTVISQEPPYIKNFKVKPNSIIKVIINK